MIIMRKAHVLALLIMSAVLFAGCGKNQNQDEMITITDMAGDVVNLKQNPRKVAVISRAAADMMIGFGLGDLVDGMYQSILKNKWTEVLYPDVTQYHSYGYNESAELFLSRGIELVLAPEKHLAEALREKGVNAITVNLYGTPRYDVVLYKIADLIAQIWPQTDEKVNLWKLELQQSIDAVTSVLETKEITSKTIHYVRGDKDNGIGYTDTIGALVETFYEDYFGLTYLGSQYASAKPSLEDIMAKNPDIIVVGGAFQNKIIADIYNTEPQNLLKAVINNHVYHIPIGFVMWEQNSMALPLFLYDQANKLYPEYFDFDIENLTKANFKRYFDVELTTEQVNNMLVGRSANGDYLAS